MHKLDDPKLTLRRQSIIKNKKILESIYLDFYNRQKAESDNLPSGKLVELGSGAGFIKEVIPDVITTDIMDLGNVDLSKVSAEKLPFKNNSISAIYMLNTLHHINNPEKAFKEFDRVLMRNGKIIMIEPWNTILGRFVNQNFHHEQFDVKGGWKLKIKGPLSGGNGAIPWIILKRDKEIFDKKFPKLTLEKIETHTPARYILSGGFSKPQLVPNFLTPLISFIENILSPFNNQLGLFATIVIKKL